MKTGLWLALASVPVAFAFALAPPTGSQASAAQSGFVGQTIQYEPVLIYDKSGGTLTGPVRETLTVYDNGVIHDSELVDDGTFSASTGRSTYANASLQDVKDLVRKLAAAGADTLPDALSPISDVPLHSVTFIKKPGTNAKAHSFSFFLSGPGYLQVSQVIQGFIAEQGLGSGTSF